MPRIGDRLRKDDLQVEVVDLDGRRIDKLLISPAAGPGRDSLSSGVGARVDRGPGLV